MPNQSDPSTPIWEATHCFPFKLGGAAKHIGWMLVLLWHLSKLQESCGKQA